MGIDLRKKRQKRSYLKSTDHRLDIGPAGRNMFISRDKQAQDREARRIQVWMRVIIVLVILVLVASAGLFIAFYMVPYFQSEFTVSGTGESETPSLPSSFPEDSLPLYDGNGLPIFGDDVNLLVVNEGNPAGEELAPETVEMGGVQVNSHISDALRALIAAAKEDGLTLVFTEGYVSYADQQKRFDAKVKELMEGPQGLTTVMARTEAKRIEPEAGENDFQTGLCLRLDGEISTFDNSQTYSWLKANMGKYGFVFRYPKGKEDATGHQADPTVIRYVGVEHAAGMQQRSMCLEEYISYLGNQ